VVVDGRARFTWQNGSLLSDPRLCHAGRKGVLAGGQAQVRFSGIDVRLGDLPVAQLNRNASMTVIESQVLRQSTPNGCDVQPVFSSGDSSRLTLDGVLLSEDRGAGIAVASSSAQPTRLRRVAIEGFEAGVVVEEAPADLGTASDPGENVFHGAGVNLLDAAAHPGILHAAGNTWNASTQGADAAGHYAPGTAFGSSDERGQNVAVVTAGQTVVL
jgi:hypothetical protein